MNINKIPKPEFKSLCVIFVLLLSTFLKILTKTYHVINNTKIDKVEQELLTLSENIE